MKAVAYLLCGVLAAGGALFLFAYKEGELLEVVVALASPQPVLQDKEVKIFAAGDMLFDRKIRQVSVAQGDDFVLSCMGQALFDADFAVANLEGPITEHASRSVGSVVGSTDNYFFTFPTTTASLLLRHNFRVVGIGNNHITNFGISGLISTQWYLSHAGVGYFGGIKGDEGVFETEENGIEFAFVGYNEFGGSSPDEVANKIVEERAAGKVVIVYSHWGDEYIDSSLRLRPIAKLFADSGASAVIGSHPHVVLGHEYIGDTLVYYSLGNFIFDQYWNSDVSHGLTLLLHVNKGGYITADEHPVRILRDGRTCPTVQEKAI
jgi:poly-gamma-glutamate synthesis protein (capsule biosynthesis protein)